MSRAAQIRSAIDRARARVAQLENAVASAVDERRRNTAQWQCNEARRSLQWLLGELERSRYVEGLEPITPATAHFAGLVASPSWR
jgi:hypothetical protein